MITVLALVVVCADRLLGLLLDKCLGRAGTPPPDPAFRDRPGWDGLTVADISVMSNDRVDEVLRHGR